MRRSSLIYGLTLLFLALITCTVWSAVFVEARTKGLVVTFLDVGQGDAVFIESPSGRQLLIDGGKNRAVVRQLSRMMPWYDRSIDVIVATHPDADHIGGLTEVLGRYRVGLIIESSVQDVDGVDSSAFERASTKEKAARLTAERGQVIDLGDGVYLEILFPDREVSALETNTGSIAARLIYGKTAFLFTGDAPQTIEEYLVRLDGEALDADVLKVGHHGSRTSSSLSFIGFASPEYAVYSRGCDNSYGHPHDEVREIFARFEISTLDTCEEGNIVFVSDGTMVVRR